MTRNEYLKQRYKKFRENGLCAKCGKPLDRDGSLCVSCNSKRKTYNRETYKALQEVGICPRCRKNKLYGDEKWCIECTAKESEYRMKNRDCEHYNEIHRTWAKQQYQKDKENGICTRCHKRKADYGHSTCGICRDKNRRQKSKAYRKKPDRSERYKQGLCYFCDNPIKEGYKVCEKHYQQNCKNGRSENANIARQKLLKAGILY